MATSWDPDFLAGLISVVAVERDENAGGESTGLRGGVTPDYQPVPGLGALRCRLVGGGLAQVRLPNSDIPATAKQWKVLLGESVALNAAYRLMYTDPDTGRMHAIYVRDETEDAHQMMHHWVVLGYEYIAALPGDSLFR